MIVVCLGSIINKILTLLILEQECIVIITKMGLVEKYSYAIETGVAAIFAGAGMSVGAGYVDWINLLAEPAKEIKLDSFKEKHDLLSLAQFYINESGNNRGPLNDVILKRFGKNSEPTENHMILAKMPISTYWSTNYDCLIEKALEANDKICDVKYEDKQLKSSQPNRDVILYKMHGDIKNVDSVIISRDDYQAYEREHILTREVLEGDLLSKTFLFIGFSFNDPNTSYILGRLRILLSGNTRPHYCFIKRVSRSECTDQKEYEYLTTRQELQINDLARYGINVCLIDSYEEITEVLKLLYNRYRRRTIFISGSAADYAPFPEENAKYFLQSLSARIARRKQNYKIVSGYGFGIGEHILNAIVDECNKGLQRRVFDCITLLPVPNDGSKPNTQSNKLKIEYRKELIKASGLSIYLFGNKMMDGCVVPANGVKAEFDLSASFDSIPLPVLCTGSMARILYEEAKRNRHLISSEPNYAPALDLCGYDMEGVYTKEHIDKMITKVLKAIDLMNSFLPEDE